MHNVECINYVARQTAHVLSDNALICRSLAIHARTLARAGHTYRPVLSLVRVRKFEQLVRRNGTFEATQPSRYHDRSLVVAKLILFNRRALLIIIERSRFHVSKKRKKFGAGGSRGENEFATNGAIRTFVSGTRCDSRRVNQPFPFLSLPLSPSRARARVVVLIVPTSVSSAGSSLQDLWEYPSVDVYSEKFETADASAAI